jgi:hypothetical protein
MHVVHEESPDQEFWFGVYCHRPIAVLNHSGRWHVYLDHVLQHDMVFATAAHAKAWLVRRIDQQLAREAEPALADLAA